MTRRALRLAGVTRDEQIRQLIERHGGVFPNYKAIARLVIAEGIVSADELETMHVNAVVKIVKDATRTSHIEGLPFAGIVDAENQVKQYVLWTYEETAYNFWMKAQSAQRDISALRILHAACLTKFGRAPEFPRFDQ